MVFLSYVCMCTKPRLHKTKERAGVIFKENLVLLKFGFYEEATKLKKNRHTFDKRVVFCESNSVLVKKLRRYLKTNVDKLYYTHFIFFIKLDYFVLFCWRVIWLGISRICPQSLFNELQIETAILSTCGHSCRFDRWVMPACHTFGSKSSA